MKKINLCLSFLMCVCAMALVKLDATQALASISTDTISVSRVISQNTTYDNTDFVINIEKQDDEETHAFVVEAGATLTINGGSITGNNIDHIFEVKQNAKLILDGVDITGIRCIYSAINNQGKIEIYNTQFVSTDYSVINESDEANSFLFVSGVLGKVQLNRGYISINKDTVIDTNITISVADPDSMIAGTVAVKGIGENVFASRYIDKFVFVDQSGEEPPFELDYLGDLETTEVKDAVYTDLSLQSGDIVFTQRNLKTSYYIGTTRHSLTHTALNCTSQKYLNSDDSGILFKSNSLDRTLDNYSANASGSGFSPVTEEGECGYIHLTLRVVDGSGNVYDEVNDYYLAGSNRAVFVDIPQGQTLKDIKYYKGNVEDSSILKIKKDITKMFSNGIYMRPIVEYIDESESYADASMRIDITFEKAIEYTDVDVDADNNIVVEHDEDMVVGQSYEFRINKGSNVKIKSITFNGVDIKDILKEEIYGYSFEYEVAGENSIVIDSVVVLTITPNPSKTEFVYGEEVVLEEEYVTNESEEITIRYTASASKVVGEYLISSATCTNNDNYEIVVNSGEPRYYNIVKKSVSIGEIQTRVFETPFDENIQLDEDDFIESMPEYFDAELVLNSFNPSEKLEHDITMNISLNDTHNYSLTDSTTSIVVKLIFTKVDVDTSACRLNDLTCEYTGSHIIINSLEVPLEMREKISVSYSYYDVDEEAVVEHAINSGEYTVTATIGDSIFYNYSEQTFAATLTITPKSISLAEVVSNRVIEVEFAENIEIDESMFDIPSYLVPELERTSIDPTEGIEQFVKMSFRTNNDNYVISDTNKYLTMTIRIVPKQVNTSNYAWDYVGAYTYNGSKFQPKLVDVDDDIVEVTYKYWTDETMTTECDIINAGTYWATATLSAPDCYVLTKIQFGIEIVVNKATINLDEYAELVDLFEFEYDKTERGIDLHEDELLIIGGGHVSVSGVDSDTKLINVGSETYIISLEYDDNYTGVASITSILRITPKQISVALEETEFDYSGESPVLNAIVSGVIAGDNVTATLSSSTGVDAGTYYVTIVNISGNENYTFDSTTQLQYVINSIEVDLGNIIFGDLLDIPYDGQSHLPVFVGELPDGVTYEIENETCKNVGTYNVDCVFTSTNINYLTPATITANVVIVKRPITVVFECPDNLLANGVEKSIGVRFEGAVEGETVQYSKRYSRTPINAGKYTCYVDLPEDSNYAIANSKKFEFAILTGDTMYHDEKISLIINGKFAGDGDVKVVHTNNDVQIANALLNENVKNYKSINLSYSSYSTEPVTVSVALDDVVENSDYLRIYKYVRGELVELDYEIDNNLVVFTLNSGGDIIFVEEHTNTYKNRWIIISVIIASVLAIGSGITLGVIHHKNSKKDKKKNSVN